MKRIVDLNIHPCKWCFVPDYTRVGEWERTYTWLVFTVRVVWPPPAVVAEGPPPLYSESTSTTHYVLR